LPGERGYLPIARIQPPGNSGAVLAAVGGGNGKIADLATQARVSHLVFRDGVAEDERNIFSEVAAMAMAGDQRAAAVSRR
jgi:hypothetical protein